MLTSATIGRVKTHDVVYIPGIGDTKTTIQELAVKTWRLYGIVPHIFPMHWADKQPFQPKYKRLLAYIDTLLAQGHKVSLVGASAGASVVLNVYAARPAIHGVILVAGKVNHPKTIGAWYRCNAPAFVESAQLAQQSLGRLTPEQRIRINSRYGVIDTVVRRKDSVIPGARNTTVVCFGHALTIAYQLTLGAWLHVRFLRHLPPK